MKVIFKKLREDTTLPTYGSADAAGMDIYLPDALELAQGERKMVPLAFATALPKDHVALLLPRSSTGVKKGIRLTNTVGVIDADYRGEWHLPVTSDIGCALEAGERVAQAIIVPFVRADITEGEVDDTERGAGGFGSTGK